MKINEDRLYPYPVLRLGNGNFISSEFKVETTFRHNEIEYEFQFDVSLNEYNLVRLLKKGQVSIVCHLECRKTKFRSIEQLKLGENHIKIKAEEVDGRLEMICFVVANNDLSRYNSKNFDSEYENTSFDIQKNSILAICDMPTVIIENKKEENANLPSIFDISYSSEERIMKIKLDEQRINIIMPLEEFRIRDAHKNSLHSRNVMNAMIVFPALVGVLNDLSHVNSIDMYGDYRWFNVLNSKLNQLGYKIEDGDLESERIFGIAQELLETLFSDAMDSIKYLEVPVQ